MNPIDFITAISPAAIATQVKTKIPASFTIAQAALESAWGESQLTKIARNFFGVKADSAWHGDVLMLPTKEFQGCVWVTVYARWRKYASVQACFDDHATFLIANPRYKPAFACKDGAGFGAAVAKCGYATDPDYDKKIAEVIAAHNLQKLDDPAQLKTATAKKS